MIRRPSNASLLSLALLGSALLVAVPSAVARQSAPPPAGPDAGPPPANSDTRPARGQRGPRGGGGETMGVEAAMKLMERSLERLDTLVADPAKRSEALAALGEVERGCLAAKNQAAPRDVLDRASDEAGRTALATEYRRDLVRTMRGLLDAEEAILAGNANGARESLLRVSEIQKKSHERFGVKEH